ncbi:hypothetical protein D3C85_1179480 [compost metagenome]
MVLQLGKACRATGGFAGQQNEGVLQVWPGEAQARFTLGAGEQGGDQVGLPGVDLLDHLAIAAAAPNIEAQTGAQPDQFEQVCGNASKVAVVVEKRQRRKRLIDHHPHHRVLRQPAFFVVTELQFLIGEQNVAASAPALGNAVSLAGGDRHQHRIDNPEQFGVAPVHGKAETLGFVSAEIGHADVVQVALVDHVVG